MNPCRNLACEEPADPTCPEDLCTHCWLDQFLELSPGSNEWTDYVIDASGVPVENSRKHSHYHKDVSHLQSIDVYRILELYQVTDHCIGHALKKLLCAGIRGAKDSTKDIQEAIDSLLRWQEMRREDGLDA